jgi:hypothetical protein
MSVYKPSKSEFQTVVTNYANDTASHAETFAVVDLWTTYYQSKFFTAVQNVRAAA